MKEGDPAFAPWQTDGLGDKNGAFVLAFQDIGEDGFFFAGGDDERNSGANDNFGGLQLGGHSTNGGFTLGPSCHFFDGGIKAFDCGNSARMGFAEIFDEAVHSRQNDQRVGWQQAGDERGKFVVVAEFQFGKGDGIVFINDRDDAVAQQRDKGVTGVEVAVVVFEIVMGEEDLSDGKARAGKKFFVKGHQPRLADCGAGLQFGKFGGSFLMTQNAHARADRAGADDHDLLALRADGGDLSDKLAYLGEVGLLAAVGQYAGAEFDDDAADGF